MADEAWWPDPRSFLKGRGDEGFTALLDALHKGGPRFVPSRRKAADLSGLTEATFRRHFPRAAGTTWRAFLTVWRMECGQVRLKNPRLLSKQVARDCGYLSERGFSRAYFARFGEFPRNRKGPED